MLDIQGSLRPSSSVEDVAAMAVAASLLPSPSRKKRARGDDGCVGGDDAEVEKAPRWVGAGDTDETTTAAAAAIDKKPRNVSLSIQSLLGIHSSLEPGQSHEDDTAEVVLVCEPDLHNNLMGALHPNGALYEKPVNINVASKQHEEFRAALRRHGILCLTVRQVLLHDAERSMTARIALEELAMSVLTYELAEGYENDERCTEMDKYFVGDEYKRKVLEVMSPEQLIDVVLCHPTVEMRPSFRDTGFTASYRFDPLTNMQFTRDQQITTNKGLVMGRLRSAQRQHEVKLMRFCFDKLGLPVIGAVEAPGYLEGGDYYPAGPGLAFLGVGMRTNFDAARQLMDKDLLSTRRLAVVRDDFEQCQDRMHLDCVFNILGETCCILAEDVIGDDKPFRRTVDEYERTGPGAPYERTSRSGTEFSAYLESEGFNIVPISREMQLEYGCNALNLGRGNVLTCHAGAARVIARSPHFTGDLEHVDFGSITSMYGALHCSSQVLVRYKHVVMRPAVQMPDGGLV